MAEHGTRESDFDQVSPPEKRPAKRERDAREDRAATEILASPWEDLTEDEKRTRRLMQNRLAAKRSYEKRLKRQAEMKEEYEGLKQQLKAAHLEVATLNSFMAQAPSFASLVVDPTWCELLRSQHVDVSNQAQLYLRQLLHHQQQLQMRHPLLNHQEQLMNQSQLQTQQHQMAHEQIAVSHANPTLQMQTPGQSQRQLHQRLQHQAVVQSKQSPQPQSNPRTENKSAAEGVADASKTSGDVGRKSGTCEMTAGNVDARELQRETVTLRGDDVLCIASAGVDIRRCLQSVAFKRWVAGVNSRLKICELTFTAAELDDNQPQFGNVTMSVTCEHRQSRKPMQTRLSLRAGRESATVGILVLIETPEDGATYVVAALRPQLSVGAMSSIEIPVAKISGKRVRYDSGDASILSAEAGINIEAEKMLELTSARRESSADDGQSGIWVSPSNTGESIRLFLCRRTCSILELQDLSKRLCPAVGAEYGGKNDDWTSTRLVLLPYSELITSRDSKTLCAMVLYEHVRHRLPPLCHPSKALSQEQRSAE